MMREIYARGPLACSAATDDTFVFNYSTNPGILAENVYVTDVNFTVSQIDHVMEVAGWGTTPSGTKYWVVRNSWGTYWGDMGWVKIRRGVNQMQIESECNWSVPDFEDVEDQLKGQVFGDYIHGITVKPLPLQLQKESLTAIQPVAADVAQQMVAARSDFTPVLVAVVVGIAVGSVMTTMAGRRPTLQQPRLLG